MAHSNITVILLLANLCSIANARVIETTTHDIKVTKAPVLPSADTTSPTTESTTLPVSPANKTTTLTAEGIIIPVSTANKTTRLTAEGKAVPVSQANKTTTLTAEGTNNRVNSSNLKTITTESPNTTAPFPENRILDLAFIMDTTGSMGSYIDSARENIRTLVDEIAVNSSTDLRVALIEYRDHPPQESTFVTRTNDFTSSVQTMNTWLKKSRAHGGGDGPEAVAEGLYDVTSLSWRPEAAKISVLISDAPPHGLFPWEDSTFKEGSPKGYDPIELVRNLTKREITLYTVGCEPAINPYKDFFMAMAYLTGGQYIPLSVPKRLIDAIIGGAQEELSLQKFSKDVEAEIERITATGGTVNETIIAKSVYNKLQKQGATSKQLLKNNKPLEGASDFAKSLASSVSMAEVRTAYSEGAPNLGTAMFFSESRPSSLSVGRSIVESPASYGMSAPLDFPSSMTDMYRSESMPAAGIVRKTSVKDVTPYTEGGLDSSSSMAGAGESYSYAESDVSLSQIERLVRKKAAKLSGV